MEQGPAYLDRLETYHLEPFSVEMGSALLSGKIDYARGLDPATAKKAQATPGLTSTSFYQSVIHAVWVNTTKSPYQDPRVRRALHLVLDRPILVAVVKELAPMILGGFIYPFSAFATPAEELSKRLGYQADPKVAVQEARRLIGVCFLDRAHLLSEAQMGLVSSAGRSALNMARDQPETQQSIAGA